VNHPAMQKRHCGPLAAARRARFARHTAFATMMDILLVLMADAGEETGSIQKVTELKELMGTE
jgi:hypothetical protein